MPESSVLTTGVQLGVESVHGTSVAADKKLLGVSIGQFLPQTEVDPFTPMGYKFPTIVAPNAEWAQASVDGRPDYNGLLYLLAGIFGAPTSTELMDSSTATGAYQHVFDLSSTASQDVPSFTVEQGNAAYAQKVVYALFTAMNMSFPRRGSPTIGGTMMARQIQDAITFTEDPDEIEAVPILGNQIDVYMDSSAATLGTTKLLRPFRFDWGLSDRQGLVWALNSAIPSFAAHYETMPAGTVAVNFANDAAARAILPALRAGESRFLRFVATGPRIYDGTVDQFYKLQLDFAVKVNAGYSAGDEAGLSTIQWPLTIVHDSTWGKAIAATLVNTVEAFA